MKKENIRQNKRKIALPLLVAYILAFCAGLFGACAITGPQSSKIIFGVLFFVFFIALLITVTLTVRKTNNIFKSVKKLLDDGKYYKAVLDCIPFPVHAVDNNMKWKFVNKAFEKSLVKSGKIADRKSAYGMVCSTAGANICNNEKCGIKQLQKGVHESYFEWSGNKCRLNAAAIVGENGEKLGYVETVTNLTKLIENEEYYKKAIANLMSNLEKLSRGDLDLDLSVPEANSNTQESRETFVMINESLGRVKESLELLTNDAAYLRAAAVEGRLDTRVDASGHSGVYQKIISGIDDTLEAIVKPVKFTTEYILKLANGEDLEEIENTYSGDYAVLMNSLNSVRESLYTLLDESIKLLEAGREGNLTARADTSKLKGGYAKVIAGINGMFEAFATPLNEANEILALMANNDFTRGMDKDYNGELGKLAESVNKLRETFLIIEELLIEISNGDLSQLEEIMKMPKRSENDRLRPAFIEMMKSVKQLVDEANMLAESAANGKLSVRGNAAGLKGEYGEVVAHINRMIEAVEKPFNDLVFVLEKWTEGDLTAEIDKEYIGDYLRIKNAVNTTGEKFRQMLNSINEAASQVASGSKEIASGSQNLSRGTTEQASSIEELTAAISEIAEQTKNNAKNAENAKSLSLEVQKEAIEGNEKMKSMQEAMRGISDSSANIAKIIKVIDDIAFQTNILSLNAAVEAARAGQAGKGFAVVAQEVRTLASRSATAAKETTQLIEDSSKRVEIGAKIVDETAAEFEKIMQSIEKTTKLVGEISEASAKQATGITQIDKGIEQVSTVVQTNSATAEESAAASEQLSAQAQALRDMVSQFKLGKSSEEPVEKSNVKAERNAAPALQEKETQPKIVLDDKPQGDYGKY